ncbi:helix-turn-helix transcriptional regulator [Anaerotruncus rubiinfantis]|uniref:helix-turn-helix transcriptional regulator n=1 Tax=Anaerotruncus rubiinfantis TaxID=1720200 RepID=UPI0011C7B845|nr:helix-turn-helix domain-containing protein [Anaerotruncus rubiinfantis]
MPISENIRKLREKFGITQKDLAEIAGVTDKAVSTWELGTYEPRMGAIQKISDHFGIQKSNIIEENGMDDIYKKPTTVSSDGLDPLDKQLMDFVSTLTVDQKEFLLAQLQTMNRKKKENQSSPDR